MISAGDDHREHRERNSEGPEDNHDGMISACRYIDQSCERGHQSTCEYADHVTANHMARAGMKGAGHGKCDERAGTEGGNQHGLRNRIEHKQQDKDNETGQPALQCVAFEVFSPEMPVNIQGHRLLCPRRESVVLSLP